ncbi:MAG: hypothetical protein A3E87_05580 [Gammaproteobacteria bacterium RIFCSPHIGHO2_12_FULL_35_23]|nr:MAG: hypothetical protein A3E87_05580 [Gammaproteobacteria bacterium RIFCSPHIGHO2_12_FULL_35_23]
MQKTSRPLIFWLLILSIGFYCLDYFFRISPSLVLIQLMQQYHTNPFGISLFASAFYIGYLIFQIPAGLILDHYQLLRSLIVIILLCILSFILFIFSHQFYIGIILRLMIGVTSACSFIGVLYIARVFIKAQYFTFISGLTIAIGTLTASFIQIINAYLLNFLTWHATLTLFSFLGVLVVIFLLLIPDKQLIPNFHYEPLPVSDTLKNITQLISNKAFFLNSMIGGLFYLPTSLLTAVWGISFFKSSYHIPITHASSMIFMVFIGWAIGSPFIGLLADSFKYPRVLVTLLACCAALSIWLVLFEANFIGSFLPLLLFLFGLFSSSQVMVWHNFHKICPQKLSGIGIASTNMLIMLFVAIAHPLVGYMINLGYQKQLFLSTNSYLYGLSLIPWMFLLGILLVWCFKPLPIKSYQ